MKPGCYTALVTPFNGSSLDVDGIKMLTNFQIENGVTGIVSVATTGENCTISKRERNEVLNVVSETINGKSLFVVGAGNNYISKVFDAVRHAGIIGADAVLLVDPYYICPSSVEIRREYLAPIAKENPHLNIIPYIIPSRTGTQLLPEDLAILSKNYININTVKEATGNIENARKIRSCCGREFNIFSGDDFMLVKMMSDPKVAAVGVISVLSNVIPGAICDLICFINKGKISDVLRMTKALEPLFNILTVETIEKTAYGNVLCKARNPLPLKTLMCILGMPSGKCRQPLGKMSKSGFMIVLDAVKLVFSKNPEILQPIADFFNINIENRLLKATEDMLDLFYNEY